MADWALACTVKAPLDQILAFVAHHQMLGASAITVFFDDPADPAFDGVRHLPGVTAIRTDEAYWQALCGHRPERHQNRQSRNIQTAYKTTELPWIGHLDVDEFLWPGPGIGSGVGTGDGASPQNDGRARLKSSPGPGPGAADGGGVVRAGLAAGAAPWPDATAPDPGWIGTLLDAVPKDLLTLRAAPFEALCDLDAAPAASKAGMGPFRARWFRGNLRGDARAALRARLFGPYAALLPEGLLSHAVGKSFFRTGVKGLSPRLHGAFRHGERVIGPPFSPDLVHLHYHAQDRQAWLDLLPFRLSRGAYQYRPELAAYLAAADADERLRFYDQTQAFRAEDAEALTSAGCLIEARIDRQAQIAGLTLAGKAP
jgi:hypothetical protein